MISSTGWSGFSCTFFRFSISCSTSNPMAFGKRRGKASVEAWARCKTPKPSWTKQSGWTVSKMASAKSFEFSSSPGWKRRFSNKITAPSGASEISCLVASPVVSGAKKTSRCNKRESSAATGRKENSSITFPSGRPRWEMITSFLTWWSKRYRMVGRDFSMRKLFWIRPFSSGTL